MSPRPTIPIETQREIFVECGHRCAACGCPFPLEKAHIIPWSKSQDHSASNLICLCANCHERADKDWDEATLRLYKKSPWISRYDKPIYDKKKRSTFTIVIDTDLLNFDEKVKRYIHYGLAGYFEIPPSHIKIDGVTTGSVKMQFSLSDVYSQKVNDLLSSENLNDLQAYLFPFKVLKVKKENLFDYKFNVEDLLIIFENYFKYKPEVSKEIAVLITTGNETRDANDLMKDIQVVLSKRNEPLQPESLDVLRSVVNKTNIECPRCLGKGFVDYADISRLGMTNYWIPASCRYCDGNGHIPLHIALLKGVTDPPP